MSFPGDTRCQGLSEGAPLLGTSKDLRNRIVRCLRFRRIKSKAAILTIVQHYFACVYFFTVVWMLHEINFGKGSPLNTPEKLFAPTVAGFLIVAVSCPLAGWLADVRFGRYKLIRCGIQLLWISAVTAVVWVLYLNACSDKNLQRKLQGGGGILIIMMILIGFTSYVVNAVQFGVDQIPEASAEELSALISWFLWASCGGELTSRLVFLIKYCTPTFIDKSWLSGAVQFMIPASMLTLAVSCDYLFRGWLITKPEKQNPLRTITGVLRFAASHKQPFRHRVVTYCAGKPSRIDFAKDKYGGPYTNEQVEDVKTFIRILVVILATTTFVISYFLYMISDWYLFSIETNINHCSKQSVPLAYSLSTFAVVVVPVYEFLIYPHLRNKVPRMLVRMGIAAALTVLLSGTMLTVNTIKHTGDPKTTCMFEADHLTVIPALWLRVPLNFVAALTLILYTTAMVEFTYAQSPYNMRGFTMGLLLTTLITTIPISFGIFLAWNNIKKEIKPSCDFYYYLFQTLCAVGGLMVLCFIAKWYKWRQRGDQDDQQTIADHRRLLLNDGEEEELEESALRQ